MFEITRKDFLKVVLGTVSPEALTPPRGKLWPVEATGRPIAKPAIIEIENGYLIDPTFDYDTDYPSNRDLLDLEGLENDPMARLDEYIIHFEDFLEAMLEKPASEWTEEDVIEFEFLAHGWFAQPVDPERLSFQKAAEYSPYRIGLDLYDALPPEVFDDLGLIYVEGDHPSSSFCGVAFEGDVDDLNIALARHGLNLVVRPEQGRVSS